MKKDKPECMRQDACDCSAKKSGFCEKCNWYVAIDSGYGYCIALPTTYQVPWCKDICSLFKEASNV